MCNNIFVVLVKCKYIRYSIGLMTITLNVTHLIVHGSVIEGRFFSEMNSHPPLFLFNGVVWGCFLGIHQLYQIPLAKNRMGFKEKYGILKLSDFRCQLGNYKRMLRSSIICKVWLNTIIVILMAGHSVSPLEHVSKRLDNFNDNKT